MARKEELPVPAYDAADVQVLEGLEAVRRRPGMYVGGTDLRGLHHLVYEVVDNSIDEALAGACDEIEVIIHKDRSVTVRDNGRGIPTAPHPEKKISTLQLVMTTLHAGAKFGGGGYKVSGGLHGVGVSAVNALSEWLEVVVDNPRDGLRYRQRYERGVPVTPVEVLGKTDRRGTTVTFRFDPTIFKDVDYQFETLAQRFREMAFVTRGVTIRLIDERPDDFPRRMTFYFEGGVLSFVRYLNRNRTPLHPPVYVQKEVDGIGVEVAIQYTDSYTESVYPFANTIHTVDGGTHLTGLRAALTRTINDYARKAGLLKEKDPNFSGDDVREGLTAVVSIKHPDPQFESQTKVKLMNAEVKAIVELAVAEAFMEFLERDPTSARKIVEKCLTSSRARAAARQARDLVIRKSVLESTTLPGKLADCSERDPKRTELFIVEGDSAGGSAKQGRDRHFQAILPLRGKILNTERASINKVLSSKEIQALISALGTGIGDQFNLENLRYGKVILMSVDGDEMTFVRTPQGEIQCVRIGPFIETLEETKGYQVLCFDPESGEVRFRPLKAVVSHPVDEPLYEIETVYGRRVRVTASHSVYVYRDGRMVLERGDRICPGDLVVAPRRLPLYAAESPQRLDLLRLFLEHPEHAEDIEIILRGKGVEELLKARALKEYADQPQWVEARVEIGESLRARMAARRRELGLSQREICSSLGIHQSATFYAWEKGTSRPTLSHFERYLSLLGIEKDEIEGQYRVVGSQLDRIWETPYRGAPTNRMQPHLPLKELAPHDLALLDGHPLELTSLHYADRAVPRYIPVNEALMFLLGFFVAEGSFSRRGIRLVLRKNNQSLMDKLVQAIREVFGVEPRLYHSEGRVSELRILNRVVVLAFRCLFGRNEIDATTKRIPDLVFNVTPELQQAFLRGYFLGDGTVNRNGIAMSTVSPELASQLMYLLQAHQVLASLSVHMPSGRSSGVVRDKPVTQRHPAYLLSVTAKEDLERLRPVWADHHLANRLAEKTKSSRNRNKAQYATAIGTDLIGLPVRAVREVPATCGKVYDFSVEGDENFICGLGGLCCHNTDADVDGAHIRTLLLTFFYRYMQPLIENGHLYIAQPPLYRIATSKQVFYAYSEAEKEQILKKLEGEKVTIQRYKGLGEMNPEQLWETTMDPSRRTLLQVTVEDAAEADRIFSMLMGDAVLPRRRFIQTHAREVQNLDV
ncbi:MAG: DNA gyrase subunit B [Anaerolineae bacterium]|nr:DNA gyrase subunit B [Anaerolineae bacterium]